jgi:hypothetical protein
LLDHQVEKILTGHDPIMNDRKAALPRDVQPRLALFVRQGIFKFHLRTFACILLSLA